MAGRARRVLIATAAGLAVVAASAIGLDQAFPPDLTRLKPSPVLLDREGRLLRVTATEDGMIRMAARPEEVDPLFLRMLLAYEDRRFHWHPGVDPIAVLRAAGQAVAAGEIVSGASTLSMQAARLLEPRSRGLLAKLAEMARAVQIEARLGKDAILSAYLTLAPYGGNLEGVRAAAFAWFGKEPRHLTPAEAALLVVLPQAPETLRPDRYPDRARRARDKVLDRMLRTGLLDARAVAEAKEEPVPQRRGAMPLHAPHLADRMFAAGETAAVSSIDIGLQRRVEGVGRRWLWQADDRSGMAALVVRVSDRAVLAHMGAPEYLNQKRHGPIDMTRAIRSPGSTLKPLIYGMAFEDLLVHPETVIRDTPTRFGGYEPANFHQAYLGDVTIRQALQFSLNVPAVKLLDRIGPARLMARLQGVGIRPALPAGEAPALPIALGGLGMTLEDLGALFAAIADGGEARPLRHLRSDPAERPRVLLTPQAAWYVNDILAGAPPPAGVPRAEDRQDRRVVAFKTGTSYGYRDAWAVGSDGVHVVAVWVGRPDGTPTPDSFGRRAAAPVMFEIFALLPSPRATLVGEAPPKGVLRVSSNALPPALRRFDGTAVTGPGPLEQPLRIEFPPDGTVVEDAGEGLSLVATGGTRPLTWLVNGRPLDGMMPWHRAAPWQPDGPGASTVTVVDAEGRAVSATIWVRSAAARSGGRTALPDQGTEPPVQLP